MQKNLFPRPRKFQKVRSQKTIFLYRDISPRKFGIFPEFPGYMGSGGAKSLYRPRPAALISQFDQIGDDIKTGLPELLHIFLCFLSRKLILFCNFLCSLLIGQRKLFTVLDQNPNSFLPTFIYSNLFCLFQFIFHQFL